MPQIPHLEAQMLDVSQTGTLSLWKHRLPGNAETWSPILWHYSKEFGKLSLTDKNWEETGESGNPLGWERRARPLCCLPACKPNPPSGKGGLKRTVLGGSWVPLSHSLLFCAQQRGARAPGSLVFTCQWLLSVSTAGAPCLSLGPDPKQSKMVWLFTEISHPVSKRKFKR